jgi:uncharacterized membrane-anchored protein
MFTGLLIELLIHWPARPWVVAALSLPLVLAGVASVLVSYIREAKAKPSAGRSDGI